MIFFKEIYVISILITSLLFWRIIKEKYRTKFLILASFTALAFIQLKFTLFLVILVTFVFMGAKLIERKTSIRRLAVIIIILTIVLLSFKYMGVLFSLLFTGESKFSLTYMIPLGISYLSFKLIAFVVDVYRGNIKNPKLEDLLAFMLFLPIFPAGPIERYQNFSGKRKSEFDPVFYIQGLKRLSVGYFKKVFIVNLLLNETVLLICYHLVQSKHYQPNM